jgi:ABC-2 type transport system permease protein
LEVGQTLKIKNSLAVTMGILLGGLSLGASASEQQELLQRMTEYQMKQAQLGKKLEVEREKLQRERDTNIRDARRKADESIREIQNKYKWLAVFIPPIPPLLVGIVVMVSRRLREREGISKNRLR